MLYAYSIYLDICQPSLTILAWPSSAIAVGLITEPEQAEAIIESGQANTVALARAMLYDPRWPWHAAATLGAQVVAPNQYLRSQPREYKSLFKG